MKTASQINHMKMKIMVKKARKEDDLEGSNETYEQNLGKEGLCDLLLLILSFNLIFSFV